MYEYIDRAEALNAISNWLRKAKFPLNASEYNRGEIAAYETAIEEINELPAADVRENVRGEWINPDGISICSNCGKAAPYDVEGDIIMYWPSLNYCPNCGAQMEVQDG